MNSIDNLARVMLRVMSSPDWHFDDKRKMLVEALEPLFPPNSRTTEPGCGFIGDTKEPPTPPHEVEYENRTPTEGERIAANIELGTGMFSNLKQVAANYVATSGHSFVTEFAHILTQLKYIKDKVSKATLQPIPSDIYEAQTPLGSINYLIKDIEESIRLGYYIVNKKNVVNIDDTLECMMTVQVPVGSQIIPPKTESLIDKGRPYAAAFMKQHFPGEKTVTEQPKFPPVMYSPDGRLYSFKTHRHQEDGIETATYVGYTIDGRKMVTLYHQMLEQGFTPTPPPKPLRSREEIEAKLEELDDTKVGGDGMPIFWSDALYWVLNEE